MEFVLGYEETNRLTPNGVTVQRIRVIKPEMFICKMEPSKKSGNNSQIPKHARL